MTLRTDKQIKITKIRCECGNTLEIKNAKGFEFNFEPTWPVRCRKCGDTLREAYDL